jgi:DNA-binding NarL/FixJ family response regulator
MVSPRGAGRGAPQPSKLEIAVRPAHPGFAGVDAACRGETVSVVATPNESAPLRVAIVEDDEILRDHVAATVGRVQGLVVEHAVGTLEEGTALLASPPDLILVDLALPDGSGLDLIARARATAPACKVLVISVFGDVKRVVRAIELGADGYLLKGADLVQVADAVQTVLRGGAPLSPAVAAHILARVRGDLPVASEAARPALTEREATVLRELAKGFSFKEVARLHGISVHTVGDHVKAIYRKLSVSSRGEAVFEALASGLIRIDET